MSATERAWRYEQLAKPAATDGERDGWSTAAEAERNAAAKAHSTADRLRENAAAQGWLPPEPVTQLQVVGDAAARVTRETEQS